MDVVLIGYSIDGRSDPYSVDDPWLPIVRQGTRCRSTTCGEEEQEADRCSSLLHHHLIIYRLPSTTFNSYDLGMAKQLMAGRALTPRLTLVRRASSFMAGEEGGRLRRIWITARCTNATHNFDAPRHLGQLEYGGHDGPGLVKVVRRVRARARLKVWELARGPLTALHRRGQIDA